jgi:hypothetical protein
MNGGVMKEFDKQTWLEELADKYEVPVEQVVIAWAVYLVCRDMPCFIDEIDELNYVLDGVFND